MSEDGESSPLDEIRDFCVGGFIWFPVPKETSSKSSLVPLSAHKQRWLLCNACGSRMFRGGLWPHAVFTNRLGRKLLQATKGGWRKWRSKLERVRSSEFPCSNDSNVLSVTSPFIALDDIPRGREGEEGMKGRVSHRERRGTDLGVFYDLTYDPWLPKEGRKEGTAQIVWS